MSLKELVKNADNRLQSIESTVIKVEKTNLESVQSENIRLRSELNALKAKLDDYEQVMSSAETLIIVFPPLLMVASKLVSRWAVEGMAVWQVSQFAVPAPPSLKLSS